MEERGHILYKQGKIPGSFYTGRGNEAAAVGVGDRDGSERRRNAAPPRHGRPRRARHGAVARLRAVHGARGRADAGPRRERAHGDARARPAHDGLAPPRDAPGRSRNGARVQDPRRQARRDRVVRRGLRRARRRARGDELRRRPPAADGLRLRQQPVGLLDAHLPLVSGRAHRRPRGRVRVRGRRGRRDRRARGLPRGEARDREGARGRRPDAARVPDAPHGGPCCPRRRLLRAEGDVREVGGVRPDRALPDVAVRQRRDDRGRGERADLRSSSAC